uniref:CRAL-TRIO domain-containing protein n=1 Tax=Dunaliella tertiolecta TaxID=3047 RepID=A0A7S3R0U0_DUNTE|mmetsp:Transcript_25202/g.68497  ORF Transcript_25202/g.68497 Transcript_25202/m.68497 type:complete len:317 (-) Transcript_25202:1421-2371(-)
MDSNPKEEPMPHKSMDLPSVSSSGESFHVGVPLTEKEQELVEQLKEEVRPVVQADHALQLFCNDHTYVRYMRARSWDLKKATKMLLATLEWRKDYKPHLIRWEEVKPESVTGKQMIYPVPDKSGRPIVLMRPRLENSKQTERQIKFLIYHLEIASRMADRTGVGKMCWLLDFTSYSLSNAPPLKVSITCNNILQNHYPERLGLAVCWHAPTLFSMTWKAVRPFIDPNTQKKIHFINEGPKEPEEMNARFHMEDMEECMGGGKKGFAFELGTYERRMLEYDADVEAELSHMAKLASSNVKPDYKLIPLATAAAQPPA